MARVFAPYRRTGSTVPRIQAVAITASQTFKNGALVVLTDGEIAECAADPSALLGVALQDAFTGPGYDVSDSSKTVVYTGRSDEALVAIADNEQEFSGSAVDGDDDEVTPALTNIGDELGVKKVGTRWVIDTTETVNKVVRITDIDIPTKQWVFKFLAAVRQNG